MFLKNEFADKIDMSKDVTLGMPVLTAIGDYKLYIENFKTIVSYECDVIKLMTKRGIVTISGSRLEIEYYDNEEIAIKGHICKIEF